MDKLSCTIETVRSELYETAKDKNLTDPEVIRLSQRLDRLLNEYRREKFELRHVHEEK